MGVPEIVGTRKDGKTPKPWLSFILGSEDHSCLKDLAASQLWELRQIEVLFEP